MARLSQNVLAAVVVLLMASGVFLWILGEFAFAGLCFLVASLAIYYRETRD